MKKAGMKVAAAPKKAAIGYWRGLTYAFKGMNFVYFKHPGLIRIWIFPVVIAFLLLCGVLWGAWEYHNQVVEWIWTEPVGDGFWDDVLRFLHGSVEVIASLLLGILGLFVVTLVTPVVAAPFNSALSEQVEHLTTGNEMPKFNLGREIKNALRAILLELLKLSIYSVITIPLWIVSLLVPPISPVTTVIGFVITALHAAVDYTDHPQERRGASVGKTYKFALEHFMPMFGFGSGVFVMIFIPIVNLLFLPAVVAGGTMLYLEIEQEMIDKEAAAKEAALAAV